MKKKFSEVEIGEQFTLCGGLFTKVPEFEDYGCHTNTANAIIISSVTEGLEDYEYPTPSGEPTHFPADEEVEPLEEN